MANTNLSGLLVAGVPTIGTGGLLPFTGNYFFVNPATGSDGNTGAADNPFATLTQALAKCVSGNNDVVFLTGTLTTTATLAWNKDFTHLVGLASPAQATPRARIVGGGTVFTPLVNVTGQGCIFANLAAFHGYASATTQICWAEAGQRNYYSRCAFLGMANATAAAQAGGRSITVGAASQGENTFEDCTFGLDTITRNAANATLEFLGGSPRNTFRRCTFEAMTSSAAALHIKVAASAIDRWNLFDDCFFTNAIQSSSTQMTVVAAMAAAAGGMLVFQRCTSVGATKWGDTNGLLQSYVDGGPPTAATTGLGVNPA